MLRIFITGILLSCLYSCQEDMEDSVDLNEPEGVVNEEPFEKGVDSTINILTDSASLRLQQLLENPLDLVDFKEQYGPSNSGGISMNSSVYYRPDTTGFYYQYMLFYGLKKALNQPVAEEDLFHKFRIQVYYLGEEVGRFSDTTELLVGMESAMTIPVLGELDLFGLDSIVIEDRFGSPLIRKKDYWIYQHHSNALIIGLEGKDHCAWWRYARLSEGVDLSKEQPTDLVNW